MLENYQKFVETQKKKNIEKQKDNAKNSIDREKKKITGLNQKKADIQIKKLRTKKQELQKTVSGDVGGSNYYD
jgi:hypothetical protein